MMIASDSWVKKKNLPKAMNVKDSYAQWAGQYDTNENKTRDLEAKALRENLAGFFFASCLELGCGTGKNTPFLTTCAQKVMAVDFSPEMLSKARKKISNKHVDFLLADILGPWEFTQEKFDLITFSLVLEHIEDLDHIFCQARQKINPEGILYFGELHPYKQYFGSKAKFETPKGTKILPCFNHHISDFALAAQSRGFSILRIREYFDGGVRESIPRILSMLFRFEKKGYTADL